ncbi:MAG: ABC transporter ATP-binding protein [Verrucomicrobia bacterium]|nr:ABC transporter ATP-binding protein [Verrucomicrobiota bacterium]
MPQEIAISINNVSKAYTIWRDPAARLKHPLLNLAGELFPPLRKKIDAKLHGLCSEFYALKNISFEIKKGESIGIIGKNGSGKSTLLQIIAGTLQPSEGSVSVHGRVAALLELGSGFNPEFTGRENVFLNASILGLTRKEIEDRFEKIKAFADIGDFINQPVKTYSSGMAVRLAFAVMAHVDADILIIDEALSVGDAFFQQKCMRFIREFIKERTLIFVSHDTAAVKSICNRAVLLEKGGMMAEGSPKEISELYLENLYEAQQGESKIEKTTKINSFSQPPQKREVQNFKDQRLDWINHTNLRNDIEVFQFNPEAAAFGKSGAKIIGVQLLDASHSPLSWIVGGEEVVLQIEAECHENLEAPIVGFHLKDYLGQILFGENTFLSYHDDPQECHSGDKLIAQFHFQMPRLAKGNYSIEVAIANGTQHQHVQHHWIHHALPLRSDATSVCSGVVGIPMREVVFKKWE